VTVTKLLLSVEEAAEAIGVKRTTLYGLLRSGDVEGVKVGNRRLVPVEALEDYVERLRAEGREA
jgi:excisionase family DNA binding protein